MRWSDAHPIYRWAISFEKNGFSYQFTEDEYHAMPEERRKLIDIQNPPEEWGIPRTVWLLAVNPDLHGPISCGIPPGAKPYIGDRANAATGTRCHRIGFTLGAATIYSLIDCTHGALTQTCIVEIHNNGSEHTKTAVQLVGALIK